LLYNIEKIIFKSWNL